MTDTDLFCQARIAALQAILRNLEETTADLLRLTLEQPEGPLRFQLLDRVSCLDSIGNEVFLKIGSEIKQGKAEPKVEFKGLNPEPEKPQK